MKPACLKIAVLLAAGVLALATDVLLPVPPAALATQTTTAKSAAPPRTPKRAKKLIRESVTRLTHDYQTRSAKAVCNGLTPRARRSLGGRSRCVSVVRLVARANRISLVRVTGIVLRRGRRQATVSAYLNHSRKKRLVVVFKWEQGRFLLDHAVSKYRGLLG
jgi:hypothetical protein